MAFINRNSFEIDRIEHKMTKSGYFFVVAVGTVEVTFQNETRRVEASRYADNDIVCGKALTGRYRTGMKAWPAIIVSTCKERGEYLNFGFDSRSGKHRKASLSWARW